MKSLQSDFVTPNVLLGCAVVFFVCVTASDSWLDILVLTLLYCVCSFNLNLSIKRYGSALKSAWMLLLIAAVFHLVFRIWFVGKSDHTISVSGLHTLFFLSRLLLLVFVTFALLQLHTPASYAESLAARLRFIFGRKIASEAGHISMLAFSMLPQIQEQVSQRKLARKLRRIESPKGIVRRV